jgi:hypothetical protein
MFLRSGFTATGAGAENGAVALTGAHIGANLEMQRGEPA